MEKTVQTNTLNESGEIQYFYFITLLRALATIIITNAHYTGIYPSDIIANGGLLGDVLFFSVSGFCLANPKFSFKRWYLKRVWRIYIFVWLITLVYWLLGAYEIQSFVEAVNSFIHPTRYHFIASITILYIPYYFAAKYIKNLGNCVWISIGLLSAQLVLYTTIYDKTYYHIDVVREPFIEFLFFQSMLLGLFFRSFYVKTSLCQNRFPGDKKWLILLLLLVIYFTSKMLFVKIPSISEFQIINQIILFVTLLYLFRCAFTLEAKLKRISNTKLWSVVQFLADHTLEIYCVQYVLIYRIRSLGLPFPLNWFVITISIFFSAFILRAVSRFILKRAKV